MLHEVIQPWEIIKDMQNLVIEKRNAEKNSMKNGMYFGK